MRRARGKDNLTMWTRVDLRATDLTSQDRAGLLSRSRSGMSATVTVAAWSKSNDHRFKWSFIFKKRLERPVDLAEHIVHVLWLLARSRRIHDLAIVPLLFPLARLCDELRSVCIVAPANHLAVEYRTLS